MSQHEFISIKLKKPLPPELADRILRETEEGFRDHLTYTVTEGGKELHVSGGIFAITQGDKELVVRSSHQMTGVWTDEGKKDVREAALPKALSSILGIFADNKLALSDYFDEPEALKAIVRGALNGVLTGIVPPRNATEIQDAAAKSASQLIVGGRPYS